MTTHLITGSEGQDGILLSEHLRGLGDRVIGTDRGELDITDPHAFRAALLEHRPDVVHNLAGQSSVSQSWRAPELSKLLNRRAVETMLDVLGDFPHVHFLQASSAEIHGDGDGQPVTATTPLAPVSPYGEAKAAAHLAVQRAREQGLRASNLVLFGHTSEYQPPHFALPAVCRSAAAIARGEADHLEVQDPSVRRDWGSARDHVRAFALAGQAIPGDYVIGTGTLTRLSDVIDWALQAAGVPDASVTVVGSDRPSDHEGLVADPRVAASVLGWHPEVGLRAAIEHMVRSSLNT